ncbi:hypothetical protein [Shinella sp. DD12]|uniref:hypothetical protein n=1 Tax=Shinella sp. DD12 TaxID=1410620 RepID=UPI0003C53952|nr:hypothetical protein [Shinella sp. DD12]EYR81881.1 hypothetical protein SHLA_4c001730 [Shinella sp. DD12]
MNYSTLFGSTAAGGVEYQFVLSARTWTAPRDCTVKISAFGASGSGGVLRRAGGNATGGGAGARCTKTVKLKAGDVLTLTPGAGGAAVTTTNGVVQGNSGGNTTVTGPDGLNLSAGGGEGGKANADGTVALTGGAGGLATGGDENVAGGRGGNISAASQASYLRASGGGALPLFDVGHRGGDIASNSNMMSTGGAGVGGNGGDTSGSLGAVTGGGSAHGSAPSTNNSTPGEGAGVFSSFAVLVEWIRGIGAGSAGVSGAGVAASPGGIGAGGGGSTASGTSTTSGGPGLFGGGGGASSSSSATALAKGGADAVCGGTGGAASSTGSSATSEKGGDGFILLEVY